MSQSPSIHALIIGIDNYPIAHHRLNGCVNDAKAVAAFLEGQYQPEQLHIQQRYDAAASRQAVIDAFQHFDAAENGDICLFYYSGHGSQTPGPAEFNHLDPDGMLESMVCYDSRVPGGRDLMDKELSYLIWKATHGKQIHFLTIFDCCNSGENDRSDSIKARMAEPAQMPAKLKDFWGIDQYTVRHREDNSLEVSPPFGRHIHLAAARSNETAKEKLIDGRPRGVFTYSLLSVLAQYPGGLSYQELIGHLQARVASMVGEQLPQLAASDSDRNLFFLGQMPQRTPYFVVAYDPGNRCWYANAGQIHGLPTTQPERITFSVLLPQDELVEATATAVEINRCKLSGLDQLPQDQTYRAVLSSTPYDKIKIALAAGSDREGVEYLIQALKDNPSAYFEFSPQEEEAAYLIHVQHNHYRLTMPGDSRPVFRRVPDYSLESAALFLADVEAVANWERVKAIQNPRTSIADDQLELSWYRISQPGAWENDDDTPAEIIDWKIPQVFDYDYDAKQPDPEKRWLMPAFRLKIKNKSKNTLFFSAVNLEANYRVSNRFLANQELGPGQEVWIMDRPDPTDKNAEYFEYKSIPLGIAPEILGYGVSETNEYLKIFVSTQELSTSTFNQKALELDNPKADEKRRAGRDASLRPRQHDWRVIDLQMKVSRPSTEVRAEAGKEVRVGGALSLQLPTGCQATAALGSREAATRGLNTQKLPDTRAGWALHALGEGIANTSPSAVLELYQVTGSELINADHPASIRLDSPPTEGEFLIPVGYDEETGLFYPLGMMQDDGSIKLDSLPDPTPSGTRSLGGSIKIFFQKTIGKYLPMVYNHPELSVARIESVPPDQGAGGLKLSYEKDQDKIVQAVQNAQRIALFIHGIIGDTSEMPKALYLAQDSQGKPLSERYDLVLTFDYENLNEPIKNTAKALKDRLIAAGLPENHGKTLHVFAHSMGGLVSRWMIEKEGGNTLVTHLFQLGTPNQGSPLASVYEMASMLLAQCVNGAAFIQPYMAALRVVGNFLDTMFFNLEQMSPKSDFITKELNDGTDPGIPYTIIAGNTQLVPLAKAADQTKLLKKVMERFKQRGHYDALDLLLFRSPNDIAVTVTSISQIPGAENRKYPPKVLVAACDHLAYFAAPAGLAKIAEAIEGV